MKPIAALFDESNQAGDYQCMRVRTALGEMLSQRAARNSGSRPPQPQRIVVGVAPYSRPDMQLLDALLEKAEQDDEFRERLQIFDVLECASMADFDKHIPGLGNVYQTPVVGIWRDGLLYRKAWGGKARQLLSAYAVNLRSCL